jgi:uncharacterized membrane protein YbaN (DUF454 family)
MKQKSKKALILFLGVSCLFLGLLGLVLPFLQGFLFLGIGLILISPFSPATRDWVKKHTQKYPHVQQKVERLDAWMDRFLDQ